MVVCTHFKGKGKGMRVCPYSYAQFLLNSCNTHIMYTHTHCTHTYCTYTYNTHTYYTHTVHTHTAHTHTTHTHTTHTQHTHTYNTHTYNTHTYCTRTRTYRMLARRKVARMLTIADAAKAKDNLEWATLTVQRYGRGYIARHSIVTSMHIRSHLSPEVLQMAERYIKNTGGDIWGLMREVDETLKRYSRNVEDSQVLED
jgi:hypothetical protein